MVKVRLLPASCEHCGNDKAMIVEVDDFIRGNPICERCHKDTFEGIQGGAIDLEDITGPDGPDEKSDG